MTAKTGAASRQPLAEITLRPASSRSAPAVSGRGRSSRESSLVERDDTGAGCGGGNDCPIGVEWRRLEERRVAVSVNHVSLADKPAGSNRPQKLDVELRGRLKLVRLEQRLPSSENRGLLGSVFPHT